MLKAKARPAGLVGEYDFLYLLDPAIDGEAKGFEQAWIRAEEDCDYSKVPIKPNEKPTIIVLRHLNCDEKALVRDSLEREGKHQAIRLAARLAVMSVADFQRANGEPVTLRRNNFGSHGHEGVVDDHMKILDTIDDGALVEMIGVRVIRSFSLPGK